MPLVLVLFVVALLHHCYAGTWDDADVADTSKPPAGCECLEWAPKDAPTDLAASWGKEFSYCRFDDSNRDNWRPATYDDGMGT